jgi:hypothetical protein
VGTPTLSGVLSSGLQYSFVPSAKKTKQKTQKQKHISIQNKRNKKEDYF